MKITERGVLITLIGLVVGLALVFALLGGSLAGYIYPGSLLVWAIGFTASGVVVLKARPGHAIGRLFLWAGFASAMNQLAIQVDETFMADFSFDFEAGGYPSGTPVWFMVFDSVLGSGFAAAQVMIVAALARFPNGPWVTRWIGWVFWLSVPLLVVSFFGFPPVAAIPVLVIFGTVVVRTWRAGATERRQMAWVLYGFGLFLAIGIGSAVFDLPGGLVMSSTILVPAGFVVAVTRYKLYEIDRIVSRTVSYVVVIGVLGAAYAGLVLALRSVVPVEGPLPVALSTLAVAFAFFPLLRRVQRVVDRRFFRSRYDAAGVVAAFADELRSTLDPNVAAARAEAVVEETFQAESVSVWLAQEPA